MRIRRCGVSGFLMSLGLMVCMLAPVSHAATGYWLSDGVPVDEFNVGLGQTATLDFAIDPSDSLLVEAYYVDLWPTSPAIDMTGWASSTATLLLDQPPFVQAVLAEPLLAEPGSLTVLGSLTFSGLHVGTHPLEWAQAEAVGSLGGEPIIPGMETFVAVGLPDPPDPGGLFAPSLQPFTAKASACGEQDFQTNQDAYAEGQYMVANGSNAHAEAIVVTNKRATFSSVQMQLSGQPGLEWWEEPDPSDPEGPPIYEDIPIPADASGDFEGMILFDPSELGLAQGTPLEMTVSATDMGFSSGYASWECTVYRDEDIIALLDPANLEATLDVLVGETDLSLAVNASDSDNWDSFNDSLSVTITAVPEPSTLGMLVMGVMGLLRRRRRLSR